MKQLRIPGPTPVPELVKRAMIKEMINHRSYDFQKLFLNIQKKLKKVFQTENQILIFSGSGTGGMESVIVNLFSPKEKVLIVSIGEFGDRFIEVAKTFNLQPIELKFPLGSAAEPKKVEEILNRRKEIKSVIITHNETSTGITNDLKKIAKVVKNNRCLLIVDAVSSLGAIDLAVDKLGVDVVFTASQKALMSPPGLVIISVGKKAWDKNKKARLPRFYWDWQKAAEYLAKGETPFTPAIVNLFGLDASLELILKEGLSKVFSRHRQIGKYVRKRLTKMNLELLAVDTSFASNTITAVKVPLWMKVDSWLENLKKKYGICLAAGQGELKNKIFRIAHMGFVNISDMRFVCDKIEKELSSSLKNVKI
jgi:aspartate aminotransferase-like enzyme